MESPEKIETRCIQPGGIWWELKDQVIGHRVYYHAEIMRDGRVFHVTAAMDSEIQVQAYVKRLYPQANEYKGE